MKLAAGWILVSSALAHADPSLEEYGAGDAPHAAQQLVSAACDLTVELRGAVATAEVHERILNPGPGALAASYELELPRGAVLTGAALGRGGAPEPALAVSAQFSTTIVDGAGVLGADPLIVTAVPGDGAPRYRAVIQPIAPGHEVSLTLRYTTVAEVRGGALRLVLPGRPAGTGLAACHGTVRAIPGPHAKIAGFRIAGTGAEATDAGARRSDHPDRRAAGGPVVGTGTGPASSAGFTVAGAPVTIDVDLDLAGTEPTVWTQTEDLGVGWRATLVTVLAPPLRARGGAGRALFVIDSSRSMDLVGRGRVVQVMRAVAAALPGGTEVDAILFDRTAARVLGEFRPAAADTLAALEAGLQGRPAGNGSDLGAAFALAHAALAGQRGPAMVVVISDGVLGDADGAALSQALDESAATLDVHAILLDPAHTRSPNAGALRGPVNRYGGTVVEVDGDDLDAALAGIGDWVRPAALKLGLGRVAVPDQVSWGSGFTRTYVHHEVAPALTLTGHGEASFRVAARPGPSAPVAQLALAAATDEDFAQAPEPSDAERARAHQVRARARALHPAADADHAFAVLAQAGTVAASRRAMIRGGGPYQRTVLLADPAFPPAVARGAPGGSPAPAPSAIDKLTLERLFRDQLAPRAYACYQRALGRSPRLVGTAYFEIHLGRGEVTEVTVSGTGDAAFEACLLDAAYALTPPLPDVTINADDQTLARYPLRFSVRDDHPILMPGDADSSSPLDIDAIQGGVPERRRAIRVDASTPLGGLPRHP